MHARFYSGEILPWGPGVKLHSEYVIMQMRQACCENMVGWGLGSVTSTLRLLGCYRRQTRAASCWIGKEHADGPGR